MYANSYRSPSYPEISLPRLSILDQPQLLTAAPHASHREAVEPAAIAPAPAFIMLGLDDKGKPHASWFAEDQAAAANGAADLMDMAVIEAKTPDLVAIAATLPRGKLFDSGRAFVPFVKRETYAKLATYLDDDYVTASAARVETAAAAASAGAGAADYSKASKGETTARLPEDWSKLAVGDRVLASDGPGDGWYEADVQEVLPDDKFRLRWRDWPELSDFTRGITDIALLHPRHVDA